MLGLRRVMAEASGGRLETVIAARSRRLQDVRRSRVRLPRSGAHPAGGVANATGTRQPRRGASFDQYASCGYTTGSEPRGAANPRNGIGTTIQSLAEQENEKLKAAGKPPITIVPFPTETDAIQALRIGQVDAYGTTIEISAYYVFLAPKLFELAGDPFNTIKAGIGLRKDDPEIEQALNAGLRRYAGRWDLAEDPGDLGSREARPAIAGCRRPGFPSAEPDRPPTVRLCFLHRGGSASSRSFPPACRAGARRTPSRPSAGSGPP